MKAHSIKLLIDKEKIVLNVIRSIFSKQNVFWTEKFSYNFFRCPHFKCQGYTKNWENGVDTYFYVLAELRRSLRYELCIVYTKRLTHNIQVCL